MHSDQCAVFLRDACVKLNIRCTSFRAERQASDFLSVFYYNLPIVEGKDGLFVFFLSFFFFFTRWGKPLIRKSPTNVRSNKRKKKNRKAPRFRPRKRSQSIIIYSHCIAQDHSHTRTHLKDYFRLMGL